MKLLQFQVVRGYGQAEDNFYKDDSKKLQKNQLNGKLNACFDLP